MQISQCLLDQIVGRRKGMAYPVGVRGEGEIAMDLVVDYVLVVDLLAVEFEDVGGGRVRFVHQLLHLFADGLVLGQSRLLLLLEKD